MARHAERGVRSGPAAGRAPAGWPSCRVCGCREHDACVHPVPGSCRWIEADLCSHCALRRHRRTSLAATAPAIAVAAILAFTALDTAAQEAVDPACPPAIQEALEAAAEAGASRSMALVRSPEVGIREPEPLLDLSCLEDLWRAPFLDVLFAPPGAQSLFGLLERKLCAAARDLYRANVARPLRRGIYRTPGLEVLPGLAPPAGEPPLRTGIEGEDNPNALRRLLGDPQ